ncbi:hypothetical protein [Rhodohalobacter halophilus]|uniref:hypothetical protein n=1 Tax=Rhodohalobacter halophilus TaxID=1812810 RepID=UPI00083F77DA|nr:hypothetical protein [Rhodohalobacter halophilus]
MKTRALHQLKTHSTLQEIISAHETTEDLLRSIGIQTELNENKTLLQICSEKQWNEEELLKWLRKQARTDKNQYQNQEKDYKIRSPKELETTLRGYEKDLIKQCRDLESNFHRVCKVHGIQYPIIKKMHWHLNEIIQKIQLIFMMLNKTINPLLTSIQASNSAILDRDAKNYNRTIELIVQDEHQITDHIQKINEINSHPERVEGVCATMKTVFQDMENFFSQTDALFRLLRTGIIPKLNREINKN